MTSNLLYAIGTLAFWAGAALLLRFLFLSFTRSRGAAPAAGAGGVLMLVAATTPALHGSIGVPIVWLAMPFPGWAATAAATAALAAIANRVLEPDRGRFWAIPAWVGIALIFVLIYRADPENRIDLLRGRIDMGLATLLALAGLSIACVGAMAWAGHAVRRRASKFAVHAALLTGCVVFGIPFAWLLITSFKEDRDMASPHGLVWIPRVQRTVPYKDPKDPLLEGTYQGDWVQATPIGKTSSGSTILEVQRPSSLAGISFVEPRTGFRIVPKDAPVVEGSGFTGFVAHEMNDGRRVVQFLTPPSLRGKQRTFLPGDLQPVRDIGLRTRNYTEALEAMPAETDHGLVYLKNTLLLVVLSVVGTLLSSSLVAFGFARLRFPGRELLFKVLLATMMLPGAVTLMPQFLLFRSLGWIDSLLPIWVPAFFAGAFNVFLLRQFLAQIPMELEDAGKIDGAGVLRMFWTIMLPQVKPALAVVAIWTFMGAWNNFMGPLIYVNTPENMPLSYALQLFQSERGGEPGLMMAFATLTILPVVALFFFAQRYFIEGVTFTGFGGR